MSRLTDLIAQVKAKDPQMGADLEREFKDWSAPKDLVGVFPIRKNGTEGRWMLGPGKAREAWAKGYLHNGKFAGTKTPIYYLAAGEQERCHKTETGEQRTGRYVRWEVAR